MRLLFLCSCLEPGRDGVGDYARLLAEACARQGHSCTVLALNDPFVDAPFEMYACLVSIGRLSSAMPWPARVERVRAFRERIKPDWISLNLVSYGFHPRGLLHGLAGFFHEMAGDVPVQLMLHEVWLGGGEPTPLRHKFTGFFQRIGIEKVLARLRPRVVTTSNPVYAAMLQAHGIPANVLPLFGNIPVCGKEVRGEPLKCLGLALENRASWWLGLFFGGLPAEWEPEPFLGLLQEAAAKANRQVCLVLAGRAGGGGEALWKKMEATYAGRIRFVALGETPPDWLSAWMHEADFGVAASPWQLIGKSGSAAAMLDHGLPVIVTRDDFQPYVPGDRPPSADPLVHRLDQDFPARLAAGLPRRLPRHRVDEIATQLLQRLETALPSTPATP